MTEFISPKSWSYKQIPIDKYIETDWELRNSTWNKIITGYSGENPTLVNEVAQASISNKGDSFEVMYFYHKNTNAFVEYHQFGTLADAKIAADQLLDNYMKDNQILNVVVPGI